MATKNVTKPTKIVKRPAAKPSYEDLPKLINENYQKAEDTWNRALEYAIRTGRYLKQAKEGTQLNQWTGYLKVNCPDIEPRMAQHCVRFWENGEEIRASGVQTLRAAIKLLARPKSDDKENNKLVTTEDTHHAKRVSHDVPSKSKQKLVTTDDDEDEEETTEPQRKVVKLPTKKGPEPEPEEDENEINNDQGDYDEDKDEIIEELEEQIEQLKAEIAKLKAKLSNGEEDEDFSDWKDRALCQEIAKRCGKDLDRANFLCNNVIIADVLAAIDPERNYDDEEEVTYDED
jgi:uncharacterized small protein (DUF1192 family)